jgi:RsiW-degrading membrane proteinase PrsW (M82 family)
MRTPASGHLLSSRRWLGLLCGGAALWVACIVASATVWNFSLIPTELLLGSFLVPVIAVVWCFDRRTDSELSAQRIAVAFLGGGSLVVVVLSILEAGLYAGSLSNSFGIALTEELMKLCALALASIGLRHYTTRNGIVLGATIGFGYAAFESSGYALNAFMADHSLADLVWTEILRASIAPVMHGLWTAILGGFLFRTASHTGRLRLTSGLCATYLLVSTLHGLWDSMATVSAILTSTPQRVFDLAPTDNPILRSSVPDLISSLTGEMFSKFLLFEAVQLLIAVSLSVVGVFVLLVISGAWRGPSHSRSAPLAPRVTGFRSDLRPFRTCHFRSYTARRRILPQYAHKARQARTGHGSAAPGAPSMRPAR